MHQILKKKVILKSSHGNNVAVVLMIYSIRGTTLNETSFELENHFLNWPAAEPLKNTAARSI